MAEEHTKYSREDRDLLIELRTQMTDVRETLRDLNNNTVTRLSRLETDKLDRADAKKLQEEAQAIHTDFENRLRFLERYVWGALAVVAVLTFLLNYFHPFTN